jgi:cardiolipin synthase
MLLLSSTQTHVSPSLETSSLNALGAFDLLALVSVRIETLAEPASKMKLSPSLIVVFVKLLSSVRNYVYLQTAYFMPNESFMLALKGAALSGADVRLMIPEKCDNTVAGYASMSYMDDLLKVGVMVYLYKDGFIHSKTIVCDDYLSSVGSVNLDFRSFFYNFEVTAFVYDRDVAQDLKNFFLEDIKHCRQLMLSDYNKRSIKQRALESCARLLSPLM